MQQDKRPIPGAAFIVGVVFITVALIWQGAADGSVGGQLFVLIFLLLGVGALLTGVLEFFDNRKLRKQRKDARTGPTSGTHGQADFASPRECYEAGMMDPHGLYLGILDNHPLFYQGKAHLLTVAPARQGKGINVVIPNLLHCQDSVFVTDPKGELAAVTARHRREVLKQEVFILNPWNLHGLAQNTYNPMQVLIEAAHDHHLVQEIGDEARNIAFQLVPEIEDQRSRWVRNGARTILIGLMLHLATRGDPKDCTLVELWRILSSIKRLRAMAAQMAASTMLDGLAQMGESLVEDLANSTEGFRNSLSNAQEALAIFDPMGPLGKAVSGTDVDFRKLKEGRASIYLVIPQDRIESHGAWLGIVTRQAIRAVARSTGRSKVLFILDEFANMGRIAGLSENLTALPALGVRVWAFVQELADIKRIYGEHTHETLQSQAEVKQFFAVTNFNLAKILSENLGQKTVRTQSFNMGRTEDDEIGENLGETGEPLLRPDEIRKLPPHTQLLFINHLNPIRANRVPFWSVSPWQEQADPNPLEGHYPKGMKPVFTLLYHRKTGIEDLGGYAVEVKGAKPPPGGAPGPLKATLARIHGIIGAGLRSRVLIVAVLMVAFVLLVGMPYVGGDADCLYKEPGKYECRIYGRCKYQSFFETRVLAGEECGQFLRFFPIEW